MKQTGVTLHISTPTLDKMLAHKAESQAIGGFIEWLQEQGYELAKYGSGRHSDTLFPERFNIEELLAGYFEIDLVAAEKERRKILAGLQAVQS